MSRYKLVAPNIDLLLRYFDHRHMNPSVPTPALTAAMEPLFSALTDLAPLENNEEVKTIWLQIPRGSIDDYDSYEDLLEYGEVKTKEEYEARWLDDYPSEIKWYRLVIVESVIKEGIPSFRAVSLDNKTIISAALDRDGDTTSTFSEEAAVSLCNLIINAVSISLSKLKKGTYNKEVNEQLPYWFCTGVIKRSILWEKDPNWKEDSCDGLSSEAVSAFKQLPESSMNNPQSIGRIKSFTANDFFRACAIGYKALNYDCGDLSPSELYLRYADGRDEGLTGKGCGLNEGPGISFDDPSAWDKWYFSNRGGGHPWEIIRGGNSTHVDLFVHHDKADLDWKLRSGQISDEDYEKQIENTGYYYVVCGKYRPLEAVTFYVMLSAAGLPVVLEDAEEILARFEGSDYIGIVPHHVIPKYCEGMFPAQYGHVIDFIHVYDEDLETIEDSIEWLPEPEAKLITK